MAQYIDKATIMAEIEKRKQELHPTNTHKMQVGEKMDRDVLMWLNALNWIKKVIDTIEVKKEPVSEDLEEAAKKAGQKYFPDKDNIWARPNYEAKAAEYAFKDGVNWQKEQMIDKACEWLKSYRQDTPDGIGYIAGIVDDETIEDFKKAMEE